MVMKRKAKISKGLSSLPYKLKRAAVKSSMKTGLKKECFPEKKEEMGKQISEKPSGASSSGLHHVCSECSKSFSSTGKLQQHMYVHTGEKPFRCGDCSKSFSSKFKLMRHALIHSNERKYHCTFCERCFHRKDHLKNHLQVHNPDKKLHRCEQCHKEYNSRLSYRKHIAVHAAEAGDLNCKVCGKNFDTTEEILYHLKVHAGSRTVKNPNEKKFKCEFCDRRFFTRKDVKRHLVVHTGRRDFLCQFCPQRFGRKDHLVRHIKKSHCMSNSSNSQPDIMAEKDVNTTSLIHQCSSPFTSSSSSSAFVMPSVVPLPPPSSLIPPKMSYQKTESKGASVPSPDIDILHSSSVSPVSMLFPIPLEEIKVERSESMMDSNSCDLGQLLGFLPINSSQPVSPLNSLSSNLSPSPQINSNVTPLPRFSQAFH